MNKTIFLIPSTYGLIGWLVAILFIITTPVYMYTLTIYGYIVLAYTLVIFFISTSIFYYSFSKSKYHKYISITYLDFYIFYISSALGLIGLLVYLSDLAGYYGGVGGLVSVLLNSALEIRANVDEYASYSFQLSYLSWISVFVGSLIIKLDKSTKFFKAIILLIILIEFFINLLFIDRTRPIWIIYVTLLGFIFCGDLKDKKISKNIFVLSSVPAFLFITFSYYVQKYNDQFGIFGTMSAYIISGIGYIDDLLNDSSLEPSYYPVRTFLPLSKTLESFGVLEGVPSNVLVDRFIPFATNVGTLHEPYISDGGILYLFLFFPLITATINYIALVSYKSKNSIGLFMWSNCIFVSAISFFVPKYNSVPFYLFVIIYCVVSLAFVSTSKSKFS